MIGPSGSSKRKTAVLITGASTGLGKALAIDLAGRGFLVFAGVRQTGSASELSRASKNIVPLLLDVTVSEQIQAALDFILKFRDDFEVFCLVNNAGIVVSGPIEALPMVKWREQFDVNFFGVVELTFSFLPLLKETRGRVINISSTSGFVARPLLGAYAASKFALEGMTDSLRRETSRFGVHVTLIEPGFIGTQIWKKTLDSQSGPESYLIRYRMADYVQQSFDFLNYFEELNSKGLAVEMTVRAVRKAVISKSPPSRAVVDTIANRLRLFFLRVLPTRWVDRITANPG